MARMLIPSSQVSPNALRAIVEEFVTRDGTDHSMVARRIERVMRQLEAGQLDLHFDEESGTCDIRSGGKGADASANAGGANEGGE